MRKPLGKPRNDVSGHARRTLEIPRRSEAVVVAAFQPSSRRRFACRAWVDTWSEMTARQADFEITWTDWETRNFGRVRIPRMVHALSLDAAARLLGRMNDATKARHRFDAIRAVDGRLAGIAHQWPSFIAMSTQDFTVLCRFLAQIATQGIPKTRLREVPCAGMHTKLLENHRAPCWFRRWRHLRSPATRMPEPGRGSLAS